MLPLRTALACFSLLISSAAHAQEFIGFDRTSFGKVILSQKQSTAWINDIRLELANGAYNNEPIQNYSATSVFARIGRSVGRLDVLTDKGVFPCTAFVVSDRYLLTNYHCVPGILDDDRVKALRIEAVNFVAGYVQEGVTQGTRSFNVNPVPVEADLSLDYAVLEVFGDPSAEFGKLELSDHLPASGDPYWVIGHPMGEAQRISREKCKANDPAVDNKRLLHTCDTLPGNSGSPLIDASLQKVVGLHHAGSHTNSVNYAIPMADILKQSNVLKVALPDQPAVVSVAPQSDPCDPQFALAKQVNQCAVWDGYLASCPSHSKASEARRLQASACSADSCDAVFRGARASNTCDGWKSYTEACGNHVGMVVAEMAVELTCKPVADEKPVEKSKQTRTAPRQSVSDSSQLIAQYVRLSDEAYGREDYAKAFEFAMLAAESGENNSQYRIGQMYENGQGITRNEAEALKWYRKAAVRVPAAWEDIKRLTKTVASGSKSSTATVEAWVKAGDEAKNRGDYKKAAEFYQRAANAGDACAQYKYGSMYASGRGTIRSTTSAIYWYQKAVTQNGKCSGVAKFDLERLTESAAAPLFDRLAPLVRPVARPSEITQKMPSAATVAGWVRSGDEALSRKDYELAAELYRKAADQGYAQAQYNLGYMYANGRGVPQNYTEAVKWYGKAADQGHVRAQNNLGYMYANGRGVPQNYTEAVKWYGKAADQWHAGAQNILGYMYETGRGVPKNNTEAVMWYRKAADQGHAGAQCNLALLTAWFTAWGKGTAKDPKSAADWTIKSVQNGEDWCITNLTENATVREIQKILKQRGLYTGAIDGSNGPNTQAAMRKLLPN